MTERTPAGHEQMRRNNLLLVLAQIGGHWPIDKADLARRSGLSWGAISSITEELLRRGLIRATKTPFAGRGRNPTLFTLRRDARSFIGIDLGATTVRAQILDLEGRTVHSACERSPLTRAVTPEQAIAHCAGIVQKLVADKRIPRSRVMGVGVGIAGTVDAERGICLAMSGQPRWENVPVVELFRSAVRLPVMLDRSGNCVAYAEWNYGAALRLSHAICLSLGDSLSAGFIVDGHVYRGAQNYLGEIGQMTTSCDAAGARLADVASNTALRDKWRKLTGQSISAKQIHDLAMAGNAKAEALFEEVGSILGSAIGNLVNLLNPQRVILGGRLTDSRPLFEKTMQESLSRTVRTPARFDVQTSQLGEMDVAKGAAALLMARAMTSGEGLLYPIGKTSE